jgi:hypothetical protein
MSLKDFLNEVIRERTAKNPAFPDLVAGVEARRKFARRLAALREARQLGSEVLASCS